MKLAHVLIPDFPIQVEILGNPSLRQKPVGYDFDSPSTARIGS